jgi:hypothetical protein
MVVNNGGHRTRRPFCPVDTILVIKSRTQPFLFTPFGVHLRVIVAPWNVVVFVQDFVGPLNEYLT